MHENVTHFQIFLFFVLVSRAHLLQSLTWFLHSSISFHNLFICDFIGLGLV